MGVRCGALLESLDCDVVHVPCHDVLCHVLNASVRYVAAESLHQSMLCLSQCRVAVLYVSHYASLTEGTSREHAHGHPLHHDRNPRSCSACTGRIGGAPLGLAASWREGRAPPRRLPAWLTWSFALWTSFALLGACVSPSRRDHANVTRNRTVLRAGVGRPQ